MIAHHIYAVSDLHVHNLKCSQSLLLCKLLIEAYLQPRHILFRNADSFDVSDCFSAFGGSVPFEGRPGFGSHCISIERIIRFTVNIIDYILNLSILVVQYIQFACNGL